jgi:hypothetical protein
MKEGPLLTAVTSEDERQDRDLIKQLFISYYKDSSGTLKKETVSRRFVRDDYVDSTSIEVLSVK